MSKLKHKSFDNLLSSFATEIRSSFDILKTQDTNIKKLTIKDFSFTEVFMHSTHTIATWNKDLTSFVDHFKNKMQKVNSIYLFYDPDTDRTALFFSCKDFGVVFLISVFIEALSLIKEKYRRFYLLDTGNLFIMGYDSIQRIDPKNLIIVAHCVLEPSFSNTPQNFKELKQKILDSNSIITKVLFDESADLDEM